jgi:hypothetical protein
MEYMNDYYNHCHGNAVMGFGLYGIKFMSVLTALDSPVKLDRQFTSARTFYTYQQHLY